MIVESSALVAILKSESDAWVFAAAMEQADTIRVCPASLLETSIVVGPDLEPELDELVALSGIEVVPFTEEQSRVARRAHRDYGRGSGSKARLNFGDCMSYALARVTGEPLLFKGNDFRHTDIEPAIRD